MRLLVDSLIALMLVSILAGVLWHYRRQQRLLNDYQFIHNALDRLHDQTLYHKALGDVKLNAEGFPEQIKPRWFGDHLPVNVLVSTSHPWMDIAPADDTSTEPPDPVITDRHQAGLWYNPNNGIFRARVTRQLSDEATLQMYNRVNGTSLTSLPDDDDTRNRAPLAHHPKVTIPHQKASAAALQKSLAPDKTGAHAASRPTTGRPTGSASRGAASAHSPKTGFTISSKPAS